MAIDERGQVVPAGTVHLVDEGWSTLCGGPRARYVFPGQEPSPDGEICPDCSAAASPRAGTAKRRAAGKGGASRRIA